MEEGDEIYFFSYWREMPVNMTIHDIVYGGDTTIYDVNTVPLRPYMVNYGPYTVPYFSRKHTVYDTARVRP